MTKYKIKMSLIDDYIKIVLIKNFYSNSFDGAKISDEYKRILDSSKRLNQFLFSTYELLLEKLKLNDVSMDILKQELAQNNIMYLQQKAQNFTNLKEICTKNINLLSDINSNLKDKLEKLKINPVNLICKKAL